MNIFVTSYSAQQCALEHCSVHRVKMILEYAQLLCTAHHIKGSSTPDMYKPTHANHPSAIWVREKPANYAWLYSLWRELLALYERHHYKQHACSRLVDVLRPDDDAFVSEPEFTYDMLAMPDVFKCKANVKRSYQRYLSAKFSEWRKRDKPMPVKFIETPLWYWED